MALTIQQIQDLINKQSLDARQLLNLIADYLQTNAVGSSSTSYLVYTALISQTGTSTPVATILENTLGGVPVITRDHAGFYLFTLAGAFPDDKVIIPPFSSYNGSNAIFLPLADGLSLNGYYTVYAAEDSLIVDVRSETWAATDISTVLGTDGYILINAQIYN